MAVAKAISAEVSILAKKTTSLYGKSQNNDRTRMNESMYLQMPDTLTIREIKINRKVITTTLLDPKKFTREEIDELYTKRWLIEVDFRFIKTVLQMDILRFKTPDMVCKEIWVNLLAYNLIRTVMAQAAHHYNLPPRTLSFKGTLQQLNVFKERFLRTSKKHLSTQYPRHQTILILLIFVIRQPIS
ncbi:MAG: hypothetical protein C5S47_07500 [Candidatus Methanogasteraceae archaeon]|nr:MAG: hypothetical protein C5S47_07500 [ANME-2 cluster archaeon]